MANDDTYRINQAMSLLNLKPGEHIFILNADPKLTPGTDVIRADYEKWDTTAWDKLKDGGKYYFVIGQFTDASQDTFKVARTQFVTVVNTNSAIG